MVAGITNGGRHCGYPILLTDGALPLPRPLSACRVPGRHMAKFSELLSVEHRPTENLLVVALVVLSTPHFSIPRCLLELLCFVFRMDEYIHIN